MTNNRSYGKDIIMQGVARVVGGMVSFFAVFVLTYLFDEDILGQYNLVLTTINIITSICTLWLSQSILRYYQDKEQIGSILVLTLLCALLSLVLFDSYLFLTGIHRNVWAYLYVIVLVFYNILDAVFRKRRRLLYYVELELLLAIGRLFPMLYLANYTNDYNSIFLSQFVTVIIFMIYVFIREKRVLFHSNYIVKKGELNKYLRFGLPLVGLSVSNWFLTSSDRYIIKILGDDAQVGIYSTNYSLGNSIYMMFSLILVNAMHPIIINLWEKDHDETVRTVSETMDLYLVMMSPLVFYGILKSRILLSMFKGNSYSAHSSVFVWTALGIFLYGIALLMHKYFECEQRTNYILFMNLISALFNIVLNLLMIPAFGFEIAAFTTFLSYLLYIFMVWFRTHRFFPVSIDKKKTMKIILSILLFWGIDNVFVKTESVLFFFVEGFLYVVYTVAFFQVFHVVDIRIIVKRIIHRRT